MDGRTDGEGGGIAEVVIKIEIVSLSLSICDLEFPSNGSEYSRRNTRLSSAARVAPSSRVIAKLRRRCPTRGGTYILLPSSIREVYKVRSTRKGVTEEGRKGRGAQSRG